MQGLIGGTGCPDLPRVGRLIPSATEGLDRWSPPDPHMGRSPPPGGRKPLRGRVQNSAYRLPWAFRIRSLRYPPWRFRSRNPITRRLCRGRVELTVAPSARKLAAAIDQIAKGSTDQMSQQVKQVVDSSTSLDAIAGELQRAVGEALSK